VKECRWWLWWLSCRRWDCDVYGKRGWPHCIMGSGEA